MNQTPSTAVRSPLLQHVEDIPDAEWCPEMRALNTKGRCFVVALVRLRMTQTDAARAISPDSQEESLARIGYRWSRRQDVQAAIRAELNRLFVADAPRLYDVVQRIAHDPKAKTSERLKAAKAGLGLAGFSPEQRVSVEHTHNVRQAPTLAELYAEAGLRPPRSLSAPSEQPIDAEFEPVALEGSTVGLEDLL